ncbi:MAG: hypothetical protein ACTSRI_05420 [Promethearchaeota archaeon]
MEKKKKIDKDYLDYQIVSLVKQKEELLDLLYYYDGASNSIFNMRDDLDMQIKKIIEIYPLL